MGLGFKIAPPENWFKCIVSFLYISTIFIHCFILCHYTLDYFYIVIFIYLIRLLSWFIKSPWVISLVFHGDMLQCLGNVFTDKFVTSFEWVHGFCFNDPVVCQHSPSVIILSQLFLFHGGWIDDGVWTLFYQMLNLLLPNLSLHLMHIHVYKDIYHIDTQSSKHIYYCYSWMFLKGFIDFDINWIINYSMKDS